jgi:hypothetical protein
MLDIVHLKHTNIHHHLKLLNIFGFIFLSDTMREIPRNWIGILADLL